MMTEKKSLNIRNIKHLYYLLPSSQREIERLVGNIDLYYLEMVVEKKGKQRTLHVPQGRLKQILKRLNEVLQAINLPDYIQGGRKGKSNIANALIHLNKSTSVGLDVQDFFPNIHYKRVYRMFTDRLGCTAEVARVLTRLTTYRGCVPQGAPTSTMIANLVAEPLAVRCHQLATKNGATHSQFVDDIQLSGPDHLPRLLGTMRRMAAQEGFKLKEAKTVVRQGRQEKDVTGVRVNVGPDAPREKIRRTRGRIELLGRDIRTSKKVPAKEIASIKGQIDYIKRLNKGAGKSLSNRLRSVLAPET